jgi:single-strand DNA-binding protein
MVWKKKVNTDLRKERFIMLNHITVMGRLTRDPELRHTGSNIPVASFTLAVDRDIANKQTGEKETDFIDCVAWRQTGEFVSKYFSKGRMAVVSGRLQIRNWTDDKGNNRRSAEVVADNVYFGDSKNSNSGNSTAPASDFAMLEDDDSQLPF